MWQRSALQFASHPNLRCSCGPLRAHGHLPEDTDARQQNCSMHAAELLQSQQSAFAFALCVSRGEIPHLTNCTVCLPFSITSRASQSCGHACARCLWMRLMHRRLSSASIMASIASAKTPQARAEAVHESSHWWVHFWTYIDCEGFVNLPHLRRPSLLDVAKGSIA